MKRESVKNVVAIAEGPHPGKGEQMFRFVPAMTIMTHEGGDIRGGVSKVMGDSGPCQCKGGGKWHKN